MATNWSAYDAAKEILGENKENIIEIGSRYPLFARTIALIGDDLVLDILAAIPKTTARVIETGLKEAQGADMEDEVDAVEEEPKAKAKTSVKGSQKATKEKAEKADEFDREDFEKMKATDLYKLCCERGLSGKCKSRSKAALIAVLMGEEPEESVADDDWDEAEEETPSDPYAGKNARELFNMCKEKGIKVKPKMSADTYVKALKKADAEAESEPEEEDDDEWEI